MESKAFAEGETYHDAGQYDLSCCSCFLTGRDRKGSTGSSGTLVLTGQ